MEPSPEHINPYKEETMPPIGETYFRLIRKHVHRSSPTDIHPSLVIAGRRSPRVSKESDPKPEVTRRLAAIGFWKNGPGKDRARFEAFMKETDPLKQVRLLLGKVETLVLTGVGKGESNEKIAAGLGSSPRTVDSQRSSIVRKIRVVAPLFPNTVDRLTRLALALGLAEVRTIIAKDGQRLSVAGELSDWQFQALRLIGEGCSNKEIADRTGIHIEQVEGRKNTLLKKLRRLAVEVVKVKPGSTDTMTVQVTFDTAEIVHVCEHEKLNKPFSLNPWLKG